MYSLFLPPYLGSTYDYMDIPDSALYYYQEALKQAKLLPDSISSCDVIYNDLAIWHEENKEYDKAFSYILKSATN